MAKDKITLGQAIDTVIEALESLESSARQTVLSAVCQHLDIDIGQASPTPTVSSPTHIPSTITGMKPVSMTPAPPAAPVSTQIDIRTLKNQKNPENAIQMACVVAYYLQELASESEKKPSITKTDLDKYFKQAGYQLPEAMRYVLPNAKKSGYFESVSRGAYKLNAVGYNLVVHSLPTKTSDS